MTSMSPFPVLPPPHPQLPVLRSLTFWDPEEWALWLAGSGSGAAWPSAYLLCADPCAPGPPCASDPGKREETSGAVSCLVLGTGCDCERSFLEAVSAALTYLLQKHRFLPPQPVTPPVSLVLPGRSGAAGEGGLCGPRSSRCFLPVGGCPPRPLLEVSGPV